ncbi:3-oxoacyl-ACP synthase [Candidatus Phycorickettsia trachydisci]|uniref:Beta-ketoacyl-[acyl-carrier-protein] synthase III n=1 Tax=Candidatus Phycorickettsia trachydisci TaxID=2115978 RepID=A0A2P1P7Y4_9RICK|nr:beta-ketoacyl-ACP synthase III [Candidatus Phycorickettsia trachydisci]AVP87378.1 3-oxoacyl-ACP synthase [Candidatus Phycorickettsia trachydisci]
MTLKLLSAGSYLPEKVVSNDDLAKQVDTSDQWIFERTGISQRHVAQAHETCNYMAYEAASKAIANSNLSSQDIDAIIVASTTPDRTFPSIACNLQAALGCNNIPAFDVQAVCTGFIYGLSIASHFVSTGIYKNILVVGSEKMSSIVDWQDRSTCILFGDGAGAAVVTHDHRKLQDSIIHANGSLGDILYTSGGGASCTTPNVVHMQGREVFRHAVNKMCEVSEKILASNNLTINDLDYLIPHQANIRIIDSIRDKLGIEDEKIIKTIQYQANCSAASIPLALEYFLRQPNSKDKLIMTVGFGAGVTWGANLLYT